MIEDGIVIKSIKYFWICVWFELVFDEFCEFSVIVLDCQLEQRHVSTNHNISLLMFKNWIDVNQASLSREC